MKATIPITKMKFPSTLRWSRRANTRMNFGKWSTPLPISALLRCEPASYGQYPSYNTRLEEERPWRCYNWNSCALL
jgi:hypothetical protein